MAKKKVIEQWDYKYASDCIHLRACRLMCKYSREHNNRLLTRYCDEDCPAYQRAVRYERALTREAAEYSCHEIIDDIDYGNSIHDAHAEVGWHLDHTGPYHGGPDGLYAIFNAKGDQSELVRSEYAN